jgi:hypothetical protein
VSHDVKPHVIATDAEIDAAIARAKIYEQYRPKAVAVEYRAKNDVLILRFATGVKLLIPRSLLQGLRNADPRAVAKVELDDYGRELHWESLDVDHYIPGLIDGVFGTRKWMAAIGASGGAARTEAKRTASRENGRKGGRSRKAAA